MTEIAIISIAFGVSLGYLIGIIKYLASNGWRFDELAQAQSFRGLIRNKGKGKKTFPVISRP